MCCVVLMPCQELVRGEPGGPVALLQEHRIKLRSDL